LALFVTLQVKFINPDFLSVFKYNIYILPFILLANISLGMGFLKGHEIIKNLPLILAVQTFIYYVMVMIFSVLILGDKLSYSRVFLGYLFMIFGIWLIKS
jgi:uncharacterized membrane protein